MIQASSSKTRSYEKNTIAGFSCAVVANGTVSTNTFLDRTNQIYKQNNSSRNLSNDFSSGPCVKLEQRIHILFDPGKAVASPTIEFDKIKNFYSLTNESDLRSYLDCNPSLYTLLINGIYVIQSKLGNEAYASLELYKFIDGGNKVIFITIHTDYKSDDIEDDVTESILSYSSSGKVAVHFQ